MSKVSREIKNLDEMMGGEVNARFRYELAKAWENVFDMSTSPKVKRKITVEFVIVPNKARDAAEMSLSVTSRLAPAEPTSQTVMLNLRDDGTIIATEKTDFVPGQIDITGEVKNPHVMEFSGAKLGKKEEAKENG